MEVVGTRALQGTLPPLTDAAPAPQPSLPTLTPAAASPAEQIASGRAPHSRRTACPPPLLRSCVLCRPLPACPPRLQPTCDDAPADEVSSGRTRLPFMSSKKAAVGVWAAHDASVSIPPGRQTQRVLHTLYRQPALVIPLATLYPAQPRSWKCPAAC